MVSVDPDTPLLDGPTLGRLRRLLGEAGFDSLVRDSLVAYSGYCETMLKQSNGPAAIAAEAHKLRGSAGSLGFPAISAGAGRIEAAIESGAVRADGLVQELMRTIVATGEALGARP